jgi:hypothetical protein
MHCRRPSQRRIHATTRLGIMPRHCSADSPSLCDTVRHGQQPPRGTVPLTPVWLAHHTLEKGRRNPRWEDTRLLRARTGRRRDVKPVGAVTSVAISPVRPSLPPRRHPRHCINIPDAVEACGDGTPPWQPLCLVRPHVNSTPRVLTRTTLERATSTPPPSKTLLDAHRTRHDAPLEAGFARTAVYSVALYAMSPHVARTVWHACKLPPTWPIKGGAVP